MRSRSVWLTLALLPVVHGCSAAHEAPPATDEAVTPKLVAPAAPGTPSSSAITSDEGEAPQPSEQPQSAEDQVQDKKLGESSAASRLAAPDSEDEAKSRSRLEIAEPAINGGLNRDIMRRKAADFGDEIRSCHAHALLDDPKLAGSLIVTLAVDERGVVEDVELGDGTLDDPRIERCVLEVISGWSFAGEAAGKGSAELRFDLAPAD